jgi:uncharacterized protein YjbJ (UPF0337 family)
MSDVSLDLLARELGRLSAAIAAEEAALAAGSAAEKTQAAGDLAARKQVKGKLKEQWGKLTMLEGSSQKLIGKVQERYGIAREEAERQVREFRNKNHDLEW